MLACLGEVRCGGCVCVRFPVCMSVLQCCMLVSYILIFFHQSYFSRAKKGLL